MLQFDCIDIEVKSQGYEGKGFTVSPDRREAVLIMEKPVQEERCPKCGKTFKDEVPFAYPGTRITRRAAGWIQLLLANRMSVRAIQQITGICWDTIHKVYKEMVDTALEERERRWKEEDYHPRFLAVDEFAIHKGHSYATCVLDLESGEAIWVGKGRAKADFARFFEETDKILPIVREWQNRPLESAKFWANVLNGMRNRCVQDIFIACTDNLVGFSAAINAVFPQTDIQNCIVHQLRNSSKYVSYKDIKALMADLKAVYAAPDEQAALSALDDFEKVWGQKYPRIAKSWRVNWSNLSTYFKFPDAVRRLIYTTNTIEGFNRQLRKVTKSKSVFPTDDSLLKMLYLAMLDITKKWTSRRMDWGQIHAQLLIYYGDRMPE